MSEARAIADDLVELEAQTEAGEPTDELIERLNARIREFLARGYQIAWIEAEHDALVRLFLEGGEDIVALDPDPEVDAGWYGQIPLRIGSREGLWILRKGRFGQISAHPVS
jgi:hypothetical protein